MAESAQDWKERRKELRSHLFHFHGEIVPSKLSPALTSLSEIERLHDELHREGYMCPPHEHKKNNKVHLKRNEDFLNMLAEVIKEVD